MIGASAQDHLYMVKMHNLGLLMWEEERDKKMQETSREPLPLALEDSFKLQHLLLAQAVLCGCLRTMLCFADPVPDSKIPCPELRAALSIWTGQADT